MVNTIKLEYGIMAKNNGTKAPKSWKISAAKMGLKIYKTK